MKIEKMKNKLLPNLTFSPLLYRLPPKTSSGIFQIQRRDPMKKHLPLTGALLLAFASVCFGQTTAAEATPAPSPKPKTGMSKAQIQRHVIASEKKLWEAWKNKDAKPFKATLAADSVMIGGGGVEGKADSIKEITDMPCEVKSYELSDFKLTTINSGAVLLTYKGVVDGTCAGQAVPTVWASTVWISRGGRWQAFSHQETPVMPTK
jgi:hypothetical protein